MANIRFIVVNLVSTYDFYIWCPGWIKEGKSRNENEKTNPFQKKWNGLQWNKSFFFFLGKKKNFFIIILLIIKCMIYTMVNNDFLPNVQH